MRWRVWTDRLIVLLILIAAWQAGSAMLGNYWLSTPWNTVTRFVATLMNGELIKRATGNEQGSMLARVATEGKMNNADKIRYLYVAAFSRPPTKPELTIANELLVARNGNVGQALQDIWWALLNSNEFILIH